jgi:hypothetical protein
MIPVTHPELQNIPTDYENCIHLLLSIPTAKIDMRNSDFDPYNVATYTGGWQLEQVSIMMAENHGGRSSSACSLG